MKNKKISPMVFVIVLLLTPWFTTANGKTVTAKPVKSYTITLPQKVVKATYSESLKPPVIEHDDYVHDDFENNPVVVKSQALRLPETHNSPRYKDELRNHFQREENWQLENEKNTISVYNSSSDLVVSVQNVRLMKDYFSQDITEVPAGAGTGFIWDNQGHVVTNYHVARDARKLKITTKEGKTYEARLIGGEPRKDIAVLKVDGLINKPGFVNRLANSYRVRVGQKVLAIGSPFGFEQTLTTGIISAKDRSMPSLMPNVTIRNMLQTDASINPGNSGGPLIDSQGYLLGMNTAIISSSGSSAGIGFAVPVNTIKRVTNQIIQHGKVIQPGLGINPVPDQYAHYLQRRAQVSKGLIIGRVQPGSTAERAGLQGLRKDFRGEVQVGDIITKIDGKPIGDYDDIYNVLSEKEVGESVDVGIMRDGRLISKRVPLQKLSVF